MDVRSRFVGNVLREEGEKLLKLQGAAIGKSVRFRTGKIFSDRRISVTAGTGASGTLTYFHTTYERFLDMKRLNSGEKSDGRRRKRRKIHNRFVFGACGSIAERLMYEFTQDMIDFFRKESVMDVI